MGLPVGVRNVVAMVWMWRLDGEKIGEEIEGHFIGMLKNKDHMGLDKRGGWCRGVLRGIMENQGVPIPTKNICVLLNLYFEKIVCLVWDSSGVHSQVVLHFSF